MRLAFGDLSRHGITNPGYSPYQDQRVPVIDVGFAAAVKKGRVAVRPGMSELHPYRSNIQRWARRGVRPGGCGNRLQQWA